MKKSLAGFFHACVNCKDSRLNSNLFYSILERFRGSEFWNGRCGYLDRFTGLRVARCSSGSLFR